MARTFKRNQVIVSMLGYYYYIRGIEKIGKTTLFAELVNELFKGDMSKGLLVAMGSEDGYKALPDIQYEHIEEPLKKGEKSAWKQFVELVDDLVANKKEYGIELLCIDTYDEFAKIASKEVVRLSNIANPKKETTSINGAFGGFNGGFEKFEEIVEEQLYRLRSAGYTLIVLSHTKVRNIKEKGMGDDESYQMLTTNLDSRIDNVVAHKADVISTLYIDREIEEGKLVNTKRYAYFRETNFVRAGSRFKDIPERVELSAKNFIQAIETGIRNSLKTPMTDIEIDELKEQQEKERQKKAEQFVEEIVKDSVEENPVDFDKNKTIYSEIEALWKTATKETKTKVKGIMTTYSLEKISDIDNNPTKAMEEILSILR